MPNFSDEFFSRLKEENETRRKDRQQLEIMSQRSELAGGVSRYAVADLPVTTIAGLLAFATDGRKTGEGAGAGTGVLCYHDGIAWRRVDDGTTVLA